MNDELKGNILQLRVNIEVSLSNILSIVELNDNVIDIANQKLTSLADELDKINIGGGVKQKIENAKKLLSGLASNPQILEQKDVIKEQVIVLFVGTLESYLSEVLKAIGNDNPELFKFKDPNEKITFTQEMLQSGFRLGDAIHEHISAKGYSFQDLGSSLNVFDHYLGISIDLSEDAKENLILCAAYRNSIIHNSSQADRKFLKQVRDTKYNTKYKLNELIKIDDQVISDSKDAINDFADQITAAIVGED
jgi:hypothetical protein